MFFIANFRRMRLPFDRIEVYVKASSVSLPRGVCLFTVKVLIKARAFFRIIIFHGEGDARF